MNPMIHETMMYWMGHGPSDIMQPSVSLDVESKQIASCRRFQGIYRRQGRRGRHVGPCDRNGKHPSSKASQRCLCGSMKHLRGIRLRLGQAFIKRSFGFLTGHSFPESRLVF